MSRILRLLTIAGVAMALAGFGSCGKNAKPDLPPADTAVLPQTVIVERRVYVSVPEELTRPEPIAEGPINQCFEVASKRRAAQERSNARFKAISEIQGTEVKP
jgi:hypothetical protein